jgi:glycerol-1-phosphatase
MRHNRWVLKASEGPLSGAYDVAVLDLDGVVYVGKNAVPGAPAALAAANRAGMHLAFVTNNAARTPEQVAAQLSGLGVVADPHDVVTSAQAAARLVRELVPAGSRVFVIGGDGLCAALEERGFVPTAEPGDDVAAVVQGYGPQMPWSQVIKGAILVRSGLPWVASNTDLTMPTDAGIGPGNGTLVRLVADFAGREPQVAGKPEAALFEETIDRVGGSRPLVIGDRLDTDIEGATNLGWDSLLVLTGVTGLAELAGAPPQLRPTYLGPGLETLAESHGVPMAGGDRYELGGWRGAVDAGALLVEGSGTPGDWWRVAAVTAWGHLDGTGKPVELSRVRPPR